MGVLSVLAWPLRLWPSLALASMTVLNPVVLRATNTKNMVPSRVRSVAATLCWPLLTLRALGLGLRVVKPDLARSVRVWRYILPIFSAYMWTKWSTDIAARLFHWDRDKVEARWAKRHEAGGQEVFEMIEKVQGYYVKSGQVMATKREFVPAAWCDRLARLWDSTQPRPWGNVRSSILRDLEATELAEQLHTLKHSKPRRSQHNDRDTPLSTGADAAAQPDDDMVSITSDAPPALSSTRSLTRWFSSGWTSSGQKLTLPQAADTVPPISPRGGVAQSVSGFSVRSWASTSTGWMLWGTNGSSPVKPAPAATTSNNGLFTVSSTAVQVMAQREAERPPVQAPKRRWWQRLLRRRPLRQDVTRNGASNQDRHSDRVSQWFEYINPEPLASASIAQVHAARLSPELLQLLGKSWSHGAEVVVKVQHSDVQKLMGADLRNMGRIARFLNHVLPFDVTPAVKEMQTCIPKEFDFEREARLMAALRARLARTSKRIVVPEPVIPLCGPGIIVMQRMEGTPLTSLLAAANAGDSGARELAKRCLAPLLESYGQMMLVDGLFHADPHPGNMLLQADGRVVLLDFGQCKALSADERRCLCGLYAALAAGDTRAALKAVAPFGLTLGPGGNSSSKSSGASGSTGAGSAGAPELDLKAADKMLHILFDIKHIAESSYSFSGGDVVEGAGMAAFPGGLYLVCRAVLILRGIASALKVDISLVDGWKRFAQAGLKEKPAVAEARAAENLALDRGLTVSGL